MQVPRQSDIDSTWERTWNWQGEGKCPLYTHMHCTCGCRNMCPWIIMRYMASQGVWHHAVGEVEDATCGTASRAGSTSSKWKGAWYSLTLAEARSGNTCSVPFNLDGKGGNSETWTYENRFKVPLLMQRLARGASHCSGKWTGQGLPPVGL